MNGEFRVGDWLVQRDLNLLSRGDRSVQVEPKVMEVFAFLAEHPGEVLSRDKIHKAVWPDTHVSDDVLTYSISELRRALDDDAKNPEIIQTVHRRGYRLIAPVSKASGHGAPGGTPEPVAQPGRRRWIYLSSAASFAVLVVAFFWYHPWSSALTPGDFILLTDFVNTTGDPVFDGTLKHALAINLEQTPFLSIYPEERARETLAYMGRHPDEPINRETGREICVRRGIKAVLVGSIAAMGRDYVISLEVLNGQTGEVIAREQLEVEGKEEILRSLGKVATNLRRQLGESMRSVAKFDVPLEQATTASLDAFKAYSMGRKHLTAGRMAEAIPHYQRALEFDPNFASTYDDLAWCYDSLAQRDMAAESARKAFALRDRVSEYEKLSIASIYYTMATGELYKAIEILETMRTVYPRSAPVHNTLATRYVVAGELEKAVESFREAIRLTRHPNAYAGLVGVYSQLERFQEAKDLIAEARAQGIDNRNIRVILYQIGFLQGNRPAMIEQVEWASGKPDEAFMLLQQANAAAAAGQLQQARGFFRQAIETARRRGLNDAAAEFAAAAGMWEAFLGNCREAKSCADEALAGCRGWRILYPAAITLATCGDLQKAEALAEEIASRYPTDTVIQSVTLPIAHGFIELARGSSVQVLSLVGPPRAKILRTSLWPAYLSGEAYLRQGAVPEARGEFQHILDRRPVALLSPIYALAKLGFARAMAASGDTIKGRKAYQDFFTVWGNADQNLPVFRRAVAEYAGLK